MIYDMQFLKKQTVNPGTLLYSVALLALCLVVSGCAGKKTVSFKVNSVPKGAHVLYQVVGKDLPCQGQWIYLGNTPIQGVRQFDENQLEDADKITLKIIHTGFYDQVKEWDGAGFWEEVETRDGIFWASQLTSSSSNK